MVALRDVVAGAAIIACLCAATLAIVLTIRKAMRRLEARQVERLASVFRERLAAIVLAQLPLGAAEESSIQEWRDLTAGQVHWLTRILRGGAPWARRWRNRALWETLEELSMNLLGDTLERITVLYEAFGFPEEAARGLGDWRWWVRMQACRRLGVMRSRGSLYSLVKSLGDTREEVRLAAAQALVAIAGGAEALGPILQNMPGCSPWFGAWLETAVREAGGDAVPALLAAIDHSAESSRVFALSTLAGYSDPDVTEAILARLEGMTDAEKVPALLALGRGGGEQVLRPLLRHLDHPCVEVRAAAVMGLAAHGTAVAVPRLVATALRGEVPVVRAATEALLALGEMGREALTELSEHAEGWPQALALEALDTADNIHFPMSQLT